MSEAVFTHTKFKEARRKLGLTQSNMAFVLSVSPQHVRRMETDPDNNSARPVNGTTARLVRAYLDGYRPADWPEG